MSSKVADDPCRYAWQGHKCAKPKGHTGDHQCFCDRVTKQ